MDGLPISAPLVTGKSDLEPSTNLVDYSFRLTERIDAIQSLLDSVDVGGMNVAQLREAIKSHPDHQFRRRAKLKLVLISQKNDCLTTLQVLNRLRTDVIYAESDHLGVMSTNTIVDESKEQNFVDAVGDAIKFVSAGESSNSSQGQSNVLSMSDYLSRPVEIYETDLSTTTQSLVLDVWDLFTLQPSVRAKIRNYAYLRGNLHVRIAISGTPFHYGRMLISYQPFADYNPTLQNLSTMVTANALARPLMLNYLSQAPGAVVMNVNENLPVEIICPYISTKPMHRLFNYATTAIAAGTSFDDMISAGSVYIYTLNPVGSVSSTPADVTMQVYAWMTDVELGTNTATILGITTEAQYDEREKGVVERVASRAVDVANALQKVPIISVYAKASSILLSAVARTAALFGWSKPVLNHNTAYVKNVPFTNGAQTIGCDTNFRVVLDPKQELTIDPRVIGSEQDDMTISAIASRNTYLQTFTWSYDSSIMASPIFIGRVNPCMVTFFTSVKNYIQPTAMAYASAPFAYWRGDIIFRFEIVCSQYHRGKIAIFYEPNASQMTLINADLSFNKQYIRVIDIQQTQTFEVSVKWAAYRAWLRTNTAASSVLNTSLSYTGTENTGYCNGYIGIVPFTQLTSPSSTPSVQVNVYVRSENLQLNGLSTYSMPTERTYLSSMLEEKIQAESSFTPAKSELISTQQGSISTKEISMLDLNESSATTQHICEEHFGEQPMSFRALLKRYVTHAKYSLTTSTLGIRFTRLVGNVYPDNHLQYGRSLQ